MTSHPSFGRRFSRRSPVGVLSLVILAGCAEIAGIEAGELGASSGGLGGQGAVSSAGGASFPNGGSDGPVSSGGASGLGPGGRAPAEAGMAGTSVANSGGGGGSSNGGAPGGGTGGPTPSGGTSSGDNAGAAGADATSLCSDGTCTACPTDMIEAAAGNYGFCIDAQEVTNAQYLAFVNAYDASSSVQGASCADNASFVPSVDCDGDALNDIPSRDVPVVCVDYCDAQAYCEAHGKQLCGRIGGANNPQKDAANAAASEWFAACTGPRGLSYPYGDASDDALCNGSAFAPSDMGPKSVEHTPSCEGGFPGLFNMSGNVAEWERSCSGSGSAEACLVRGGAFSDGPYELACNGSRSMASDAVAADVGIRCCAELPH